MKILHISDTHNLDHTKSYIGSNFKSVDLIYLTGDNGKNFGDYLALLNDLENIGNAVITSGNHDYWAINNLQNTQVYTPQFIYSSNIINDDTLVLSIDVPMGRIPEYAGSVNDLYNSMFFANNHNFESKRRFWNNWYSNLTYQTQLLIMREEFKRDWNQVHILVHTPPIRVYTNTRDDLSCFFEFPELLDILRIRNFNCPVHIFSGHIHKNISVSISDVNIHITCGTREIEV